MDAFRRDTLRLASTGKLTDAEQLEHVMQYQHNGVCSAPLWGNITRITLFALNRIRLTDSWPRALPADTLQDCLQVGVVGAVEALEGHDINKGSLINWIILTSTSAMRKYAWEQVKAGIITKDSIWIDSLDMDEVTHDDVNDDSWLPEYAYADAPIGMTVPDGTPTGSTEILQAARKALKGQPKQHQDALLASIDNKLPRTAITRAALSKARKAVLTRFRESV